MEVEQVAIDLSSGECSRDAVYLDGVLVGHVMKYRYTEGLSLTPYRIAGRGGPRVGWLAAEIGVPASDTVKARTRAAAVATLVTRTHRSWRATPTSTPADDFDRIAVTLTRAQLRLVAGSVNEAIEAVDDFEFSTRLGAEKDEARRFRRDLRDVIATLRPKE